MAKDRNGNDDFSIRRSSTTPEMRKRFLSVFMRHQAAFDQARAQLLPEHFEEAEDSAAAVIWEAALAFAEAYNGRLIPSKQFMHAELSGMRDDNGFFLVHDVDEVEVDDIVDTIFDGPAPTTDMVQVALNDCRRMLLEYHQRELAEQTKGAYNESLLSVLRETENRLCAAATFGLDEMDFKLAAPNWKEQVSEPLRPIGIDFLDRCLGGGDKAGEVNAFMAPYGTCKTTLACMITVQSALRGLEEHVAQTGSEEGAPITVIVTWEDQKEDIFHRCLARCAGVAWSDIARRDFSTPDNLKPYELRQLQQMMRQNPEATIRCEEQRVDNAYEQLIKNICIIDMEGGTEAFRGYSGDMHYGLELVLRKLVSQYDGRRIDRIIIDHASAAAKAYCSKHNKDLGRELRLLLNTFPRELRLRVAQQFNCPVWVMHQLSPAAASKKPGSLPSMTDCSESKSFVEFISNAFVAGTPTSESLIAFGHVKHRRSGVSPTRILRIDGAMQSLSDVSHQYELESGTIVSAGEARRVVTSNRQGLIDDNSRALFADDMGV